MEFDRVRGAKSLGEEHLEVDQEEVVYFEEG